MGGSQQTLDLVVSVPLFASRNQNTEAKLATEHSSVTETSVHILDSVYCGFSFIFLDC